MAATAYADAEFYLLDSLNLAELEDSERQMLDSALEHYHSTSNDTARFATLYYVAEHLLHPSWARYNFVLKQNAEDALQREHDPNLTWTYKRFLERALNNIGYYYHYQGNIPQSLEYYHKSLKLGEEIHDTLGLATSLNNIGAVYDDQGDIEKMMAHYEQALAYYEAVGNKDGIATGLTNVGACHLYFGDAAKAFAHHQRALKLWTEIGSQTGISIAHHNIGNAYYDMGDTIKSLEHIERARQICTSIGDEYGTSDCMISIGQIYLELGELEKARKLGDESMSLCKVLEYPQGIGAAAELLARVYKIQGKHKDGWQLYEVYIQMRDSIRNDETERSAIEQGLQYAYEKQTHADSVKNAAQQQITAFAHEAELQKERSQRLLLYGGLAIALLFSLYVVNRFVVIQRQKKVIESQQQQIVESINYSKKIQTALLPDITELEAVLGNVMVLFEPKDIVGGDFYWSRTFDKYMVLACVDCTGHGVPGGFMSTLGSLLLDKIVNDAGHQPAQILARLSDEIIRVLHQQDGGDLQDGMDLSVCLIDVTTGQIEFSGARNGIIVVRNGVAIRHKAAPVPVGGNYYKKGQPIERNFTTETIQTEPGDWVYMYTDGYIEQIGGPNQLPMNYGQFGEQLIAVSTDAPSEQKMTGLYAALDDWRGDHPRTDDVLIIGFQLT